MNNNDPKSPRQALEARLTALLLGELSAEEADTLRRTIEQDAELARLYDRLEHTIDLVREAAASPAQQTAVQSASPVKLTDERRRKLLAHFKAVAPQEFTARPRRREWSWVVELTAAAAALMLVAAIALPNFTRARESALSNSVINNLRVLEGAKAQWALENKKSAADVATLADLTPYLKGKPPPSVAGENYVLGTVSDPVTADLDAAQARGWFQGLTTTMSRREARGERAHLSADGELAFSDRNTRQGNLPQQPAPDSGDRKAIAAPTQPPAAANRTEIVLPSSGQLADASKGSLETRTYRVDSDAFGKALQGVANVPLGNLAATGGGGGGIGGGQEGLFELPRVYVAGQSQGGFGGREGGIAGTAISGQAGIADVTLTNQTLNMQDTARTFMTALGVNGVASNNVFFNDRTGVLVVRGTSQELDTLQKAIDTLNVAPPIANEPKFAELSVGRSVQEQPRGRAGAGATSTAAAISGAAAPSSALVPKEPQLIGTLSRNGDEPLDVKADKMARLGDAPTLGSLFRADDKPANTTGYDNDGWLMERNGMIPKGVTSTAEGDTTTDERTPFILNSAAPQTAGKDLSKLGAVESGVVATNGFVFGAEQTPGQKLPKNVELAYDIDRKLDRKAARGREGREGAVRIDEVDSLKAPTKSPDTVTGAAEEAVRKPSPSIVLPSTDSEVGGKAIADSASRQLGVVVDDKNSLGGTIRELEQRNEEVNKARAKVNPSDTDGNRGVATRKPRRLAESLESEKKEKVVEQGKEIARASEELVRLQRESNSQQADTSPPKPATPAPVPQPEVLTRDNPYSTFSLNVSDVSFKLASASLEKGVIPEPASVRSEEFINAFDYRDPEPAPGVPIAFAWERARYPFAHNRDLLRFSVKTAAAGRQPGRPLNLVLLLDNSGSMERADRVQIIHEALRVLAAQLQPQDKLSVVTFARTARLWVDGVPGNQAGAVAEQVSGLTPQGGTNLEDAMNLAYQTALRHYLAAGVNRIVLLTDGAANLGDVDPNSLKQKVEAYRKQGIALDCFGVGWEGYNDDLLELLSRNGDGRYGFINAPEEAATEFAGQLAGALRIAASDVKVQVEFNPGRVIAYRQIGYAKHQLTKEQFRDNTVDAAEIGAAESGNALYVVAANPRGEGPLGIVRVRSRVPGTADYLEHEWAVPYNGNAASLEQASPAMRLAAAASAFSEWLVSSPYAAEVSPDRLLGYLGGVPEVYGADARPKKLEWMIRQAKSMAGR